MKLFPPVSGLVIDVTIIQAHDLIAKDRNFLTRKRTSSDPYVEVFCGELRWGKTKTVLKNLNPVWNETFTIKLDADASSCVLNGTGEVLELRIFDKDKMSDNDPMGMVLIQLQSLMLEEARPIWYNVQKGSEKFYCKNAKGQLEVKVAIHGQKMRSLTRGNNQTLPAGTTIKVGLGWEKERGVAVDLDASCVAIDTRGEVLMNETVYYGNIKNSNGSITHSGDDRTGEKNIQGTRDDEIIICDLKNIPLNVLALHFILTIVTPGKTLGDVESAAVTIIDYQTGVGLCSFTPSLEGDSTAMFLMRLSREAPGFGESGWSMTIVEGTNKYARDFGTLVPEIKGLSRDLVPGLQINPRERVAIMRKGGNIRIQDYSRTPHAVPDKLTFGLAWDVTDGVNIDLDASVICLDADLRPLDIVFWNQLRSKDGAIVHGGDEREGDEVGDDEKIFLHLSIVHPAVHYIGVLVNSYSGQELDDVASASCHLFDSVQGYDLARYTLTASQELDKHTALLMGCLYRGGSGEWYLRIISEAAQGKLARDCVPVLQEFLRANPPTTPDSIPEQEIILDVMPEPVPIDDEIVVEPFVPVYQLANTPGKPTEI